MKLRRTRWAAVVAAVAITAGYSIVRADSPFASGQRPPVIYSGFLSTAGTPLSGSHQIAMNLWRGSDTSVTTDEVCQGTAQTLNVDSGSFQLTLDATCVDLFTRYTQLYYQLIVDGTAFPVQQIGSAPFSIRSTQGAANGSRLSQTHTVLYGEDGYRSESSLGPLQDTKRNEQCSPEGTSEGFQRCLPEAEPNTSPFDAYGMFLDSSCTQPAPLTNMRYYAHGDVSPGPPPYFYVMDLDSSGKVVAYYPATSQPIALYVHGQVAQCEQYTGAWEVIQYTVGSPIPMTEFVKMQSITE